MPTAFKIITLHDGLSKGLPLFKQDTNMPKFVVMDKIKEALINRARYICPLGSLEFIFMTAEEIAAKKVFVIDLKPPMSMTSKHRADQQDKVDMIAIQTCCGNLRTIMQELFEEYILNAVVPETN